MFLYLGAKDGIRRCREVTYVLHLCYNGVCSFFCLETKERTKEKSRLRESCGVLEAPSFFI